MRPRASRIPGLRDQGASARSLLYSSRLSKWLDDEYLVRRGKATDWKRQYKLRHNWSRGSAKISETKVAEHLSIPPLLVRLRDDFVVLADATAGLRAFLLKGKDRLIANTPLGPGVLPTSLAIDNAESSPDTINVLVGFVDGSFTVYTLDKQKRSFIVFYTHPPSTNGAIHAAAYSSPYLLTMTGEPLLSLYRIERSSTNVVGDALDPPTLAASLRSHTAYPPISLAIRTSSTGITAAIAYAMPKCPLGWSVGLQEICITGEGTIADSRMASASSGSSRTSAVYRSRPYKSIIGQGDKVKESPELNNARLQPLSKPTSLSYNHPYLLSAHADNTLTLYMVTSNAEGLSIGAGYRLWGHTSSVSGAHVGDRGKAVSVSAKGNELRIWELEGGLSSSSSRRKAIIGGASIQVHSAEESTLGSGHGASAIPAFPSPVEDSGTSNLTKGWVTFDEEKVVLLREQLRGAQAIVVYDFS